MKDRHEGIISAVNLPEEFTIKDYKKIRKEVMQKIRIRRHEKINTDLLKSSTSWVYMLATIILIPIFWFTTKLGILPISVAIIWSIWPILCIIIFADIFIKDQYFAKWYEYGLIYIYRSSIICLFIYVSWKISIMWIQVAEGTWKGNF